MKGSVTTDMARPGDENLEGERIAALAFGKQDVINAVEDLTGDGGELEMDEERGEQLVAKVCEELEYEEHAEAIGNLVRDYLKDMARGFVRDGFQGEAQ